MSAGKEEPGWWWLTELTENPGMICPRASHQPARQRRGQSSTGELQCPNSQQTLKQGVRGGGAFLGGL